MTLEDELKHLDALGLKKHIEYYIQEIMKPNGAKIIKSVYYQEGLKELGQIEKDNDCKYDQVRRIFRHAMVEQDRINDN